MSRHNIKSNILPKCMGDSIKLRIQLGLRDDYQPILVPIRYKEDIDNIIETLERMREYL